VCGTKLNYGIDNITGREIKKWEELYIICKCRAGGEKGRIKVVRLR
jgi:hypothetical protein